MNTVKLLVVAALVTGCSGNSDDEIFASGTIEATEVTISAKVGGPIVRLLVTEGSKVQRGDTLALVDPTDYEIQFKQARANYAATVAQDVQSKANLRSAQDDLRRMEELWATKSITQKQFEDAQTRFTVAQQSAVAADARRDQALAQRESAKKKLSDCYILAPLDGVITQKAIEEGEFVGVGTGIVRISRLDQVYLMIYVTGEELGRVKLGQEAKVQIDTYKERFFPGRVTYISPVAEFTPKNIQTKEDRTKLVFGVKIEVDNSDRSLKPGMPADATILTQ